MTNNKVYRSVGVKMISEKGEMLFGRPRPVETVVCGALQTDSYLGPTMSTSDVHVSSTGSARSESKDTCEAIRCCVMLDIAHDQFGVGIFYGDK